MDCLKNSSSEKDSLVKVMTLVITQDRTYQLYALGRQTDLTDVPLPSVLTSRNLKIISDALEGVTLCVGLNNERFIDFLARRKGTIQRGSKISAYLDNTFEGGCVNSNYPQGSTVRSSKCTMVVQSGKRICIECSNYHKNLSTMSSRPIPGELHTALLCAICYYDTNGVLFDTIKMQSRKPATGGI